MVTQSRSHSSERSTFHVEGMVAGLIGAATIAIWFFILDVFQGRPLYTPNVLGTALFRGGAAIRSPQTLPLSFEMVVVFTWVHLLVFAFIGGVAAKLLRLAEKDPNYGFGILLFFVLFMFGFIVASLLYAKEILHALAWPAVLVGNLLGAGAMGGYFWRQHPHLKILP